MTVTTLALGAVVVVGYVAISRILAPRASLALVQEKLAAGALVVDVRTPAEFKSGSYPEAINLPLQELSAGLGNLSKDRPVVLYCHSGSRAALAERMFKKAGFQDVTNAGSLHRLPH